MPEIFPAYQLPYDELLLGYLTEAEGLSFVSRASIYSDLILRHKDYKAFLRANRDSRAARKFITEIRKQGGVIWADNKSSVLFDALCSSHLAALCTIFDGSSFHENMLAREILAQNITQKISQYKNNEEMISMMSSTLNLLDGMRTIQILRLLTLVTTDTSNIRQISLGAGSAANDIVALHALPKIDREIDQQSGQYVLRFHLLQQTAGNIVVSDNDPQRHDAYEEISKNNEHNNVFALNVGTDEALGSLPEMQEEHDLGQRNLIVALRIDHRMLPDVKQFFRLIHACMDQSADLIISIGSGFTLEEFQGRVEKLQEIFNYLNSSGMDPVLIKLHDQGDLDNQRKTNKFSLSSKTTYQILHCKLKKKILEKYV